MPTLATLVTNSSLLATFGESLVPCHRVTSDWVKGQQKKRYCEFRVRGSRVHRHSACGVPRPYWQLYSGMLAGAAARAASAGSPLPDAELCVFEGCRSRDWFGPNPWSEPGSAKHLDFVMGGTGGNILGVCGASPSRAVRESMSRRFRSSLG